MYYIAANTTYNVNALTVMKKNVYSGSNIQNRPNNFEWLIGCHQEIEFVESIPIGIHTTYDIYAPTSASLRIDAIVSCCNDHIASRRSRR